MKLEPLYQKSNEFATPFPELGKSDATHFESTTSTNSITPAWNSVIIPEAHPNCKCKFTVNPSEFKKLGLPNGRELWYDIVDKLCGGF